MPHVKMGSLGSGALRPNRGKKPHVKMGGLGMEMGATSILGGLLLLFTKIDETFFKSQQGKEADVKLGGLGKIGAW